MLPIKLLFNEINDIDYFPRFIDESVNQNEAQLVEENDKYILSIELPGFQKKHIQLDIKNNVISIQAEKESEYSKDAKFYQKLKSSNKRQVNYCLPKDAVSDSANAKLENGLLIVEFSKKQEAKAKQITIK